MLYIVKKAVQCHKVKKKCFQGDDYRSAMGSRVASRLNSMEQSIDEDGETPQGSPCPTPRGSLASPEDSMLSADYSEPIQMNVIHSS